MICRRKRFAQNCTFHSNACKSITEKIWALHAEIYWFRAHTSHEHAMWYNIWASGFLAYNQKSAVNFVSLFRIELKSKLFTHYAQCVQNENSTLKFGFVMFLSRLKESRMWFEMNIFEKMKIFTVCSLDVHTHTFVSIGFIINKS